MFLFQLNGMSDWYLANIEANRTLSIFRLGIDPTLFNDSVISADLSGSEEDSQKVVYFGAPDYYLGE